MQPRIAIAMVGLGLLAACGDGPKQVVAPPACTISGALLAESPGAAPAATVPSVSPYDSIFAAAGAEFDVPASLLRAIGYVETRWQMVEGHEEFPGLPAAFGIMALRGERLRRGALRAGVSEESARRDATANIRAAAALLRAYADSSGISGDDAEVWAPIVARFSGIEMTEGKESYVGDVRAVRAGRRMAPSRVAYSQSPADCGTPPPTPQPVTDQVGAVWRPSSNFNSRMTGQGGVVHIVIIHSCEGSYAGCWSWLMNPASQVSAHYVVREDGAEITQLVRESARAWHIGATYDSTLNSHHDGILHGVQSNHFTIGVEHAGYASQTSWPVEQIDASARLVCDMARRWQIPRDRLHIVSHGQLQPWNRTDPGASWPWNDYLARIDQYCTG